MKPFTYRGMKFTPIRQLKGAESSFEMISRRIRDEKLTPANWSWDNFYKAAKKADPINGEIDLFLYQNKVVIPAENCLFVYN